MYQVGVACSKTCDNGLLSSVEIVMVCLLHSLFLLCEVWLLDYCAVICTSSHTTSSSYLLLHRNVVLVSRHHVLSVLKLLLPFGRLFRCLVFHGDMVSILWRLLCGYYILVYVVFVFLV